MPIFLDIACPFIGDSKVMGISIWNASMKFGLVGFQICSQNKCLVKVSRKNSIK